MKNLHPGFRLISVVLLVSFSLTTVGTFLNPPSASGQTRSGGFNPAGDFLGCAAESFFADMINKGLDFLVNKIPGLGGLLGGSEVPTINGPERKKETVKDAALRCAAREILKFMNDRILSVIRESGRSGGPAFVRNWRNYQADAQYRGEDIFRSILSTTNLCNHIGDQLRTIYNAPAGGTTVGQSTRVNNLDPYQLRANCSLPDGFSISNFEKDFADNGGWEAFLRLQQPENNLYKSILMAQSEAAIQREVEQSGDIYETIGHGFTSGRGGDEITDSCLVRGLNGKCITYKNILTPGSIFEGTTIQTIQGEIDWVVNADELNELIAVAISILFNRIKDLSNPNEGNLEIPEDIDFDQIQITVSPLPPPPGGGGGVGVCADQGDGIINYRDALARAIDAVNLNNPGGIADALNTFTDSAIYLNEVIFQIQNEGLNATTNVLNGNDNPSSGDLLAIWAPGDPTIERYDVISSVGQGDIPLRFAATPDQYTGDIPLSCAN